MKPGSGVLLHITSLPAEQGIGNLGAAAYRFVDFLQAAGQTYWQLLPLGPPGKGDSPYYCLSTAAGNPLLIDLNQLVSIGLLTPVEVSAVDWGEQPDQVDYPKVAAGRARLLRLAEERFFLGTAERPAGTPETGLTEEGFTQFIEEQAGWLDDYALGTALTDHFNGAGWPDWPDRSARLFIPTSLAEYRRALALEVRHYQFLQYVFFTQWQALKDYAAARSICLIGDLPIYVPLESVDTWAGAAVFRLDEQHRAIESGGVPPDYYSADGQLWNCPVYDWDKIESDGFRFWIDRIASTARFFDMIRLDHFRGFESYWCVSAGAPNARAGHWRPGPGMKLLQAIRNAFPQTEFIVEDLGLLTPAVHELVRQSGWPGMKVLQFTFALPEKPSVSAEKENNPKNYPENSVCYTGTHDNNTIRGYVEEKMGTAEWARAVASLGLTAEEGWNWGFIRGCLESPSRLAIFPMQDLLDLPAAARMNRPGTESGNWRWRLKPEQLTPELAQKLRDYTTRAGRCPEPATESSRPR